MLMYRHSTQQTRKSNNNHLNVTSLDPVQMHVKSATPPPLHHLQMARQLLFPCCITETHAFKSAAHTTCTFRSASCTSLIMCINYVVTSVHFTSQSSFSYLTGHGHYSSELWHKKMRYMRPHHVGH